MAFDPEIHEIDKTTGYIVDKATGHISGLMNKPISSESTEYPKWVVSHETHVTRVEGKAPVTPMFGECHIDRDNKEIKVLVLDKEEEDYAVSGELPKKEEEVIHTEPTNEEHTGEGI